MQIMVGVHKHNNWFTAVMGAISFVFATALIICWSAYYMNYPYSWLKEYGIEVEATIDGVEERRTGTHVHDGADTDYYCSYRYVSTDGTTYSGSRGRYDTKQEAESHIGEKIYNYYKLKRQPCGK